MDFKGKEEILFYNGKLENDYGGNKEDVQIWLTAIFKSKHLSLLVGSGLATGLTNLSKAKKEDEGVLEVISSDFSVFKDEILHAANKQAENIGRGKSNFEDKIRVATQLSQGLEIQGNNTDKAVLDTDIKQILKNTIDSILHTESNFIVAPNFNEALLYLKKLLISFASRSATKDRLHLFTTNYDRFIEYGADKAGLFTIDRFRGIVEPKLRSSRMNLDFHYDPPGIRGEPRYLEGVIRLTKLHGSLDWEFIEGDIIKYPLGFGEINHAFISNEDKVVIYPNSSKSIETILFPYADLFRDFSNAICQPNSILVTYGYGFGDSHINRIIEDMLTIPSTHLVVISYDNANERINNFIGNINDDQLTVLLGPELGDIKELVDNYLPKSAMDLISKPYRELKTNDSKAKDKNQEGKND